MKVETYRNILLLVILCHVSSLRRPSTFLRPTSTAFYSASTSSTAVVVGVELPSSYDIGAISSYFDANLDILPRRVAAIAGEAGALTARCVREVLSRPPTAGDLHEDLRLRDDIVSGTEEPPGPVDLLLVSAPTSLPPILFMSPNAVCDFALHLRGTRTALRRSTMVTGKDSDREQADQLRRGARDISRIVSQDWARPL